MARSVVYKASQWFNLTSDFCFKFFYVHMEASWHFEVSAIWIGHWHNSFASVKLILCYDSPHFYKRFWKSLQLTWELGLKWKNIYRVDASLHFPFEIPEINDILWMNSHLFHLFRKAKANCRQRTWTSYWNSWSL